MRVNFDAYGTLVLFGDRLSSGIHQVIRFYWSKHIIYRGKTLARLRRVRIQFDNVFFLLFVDYLTAGVDLNLNDNSICTLIKSVSEYD